MEAAAVRFDPPLVILLELPADQSVVQFAITYRLPRDIPAVEIGAVLRTQQLGVSIARGNIDARPDRSLIRAGSVGSPSRPRDRYRAGPIQADSTVRVHLYNHRVSWRERLVVFFIAAAAAVAALVWVWGQGQGRGQGRGRGRGRGRRPSSDAG